ncbi:uncharacterized protein LOC111055478 [Nilaparvata lugens]|uniref:uncharacterized protein LOC111055478 n=1 Tax=Nilaparvata lugens TaxID=108931 RepID=UPI000B996CB6|nr:uncharacterized protein LOC111055478 [Nilaparvata lugens]XP_022198385.1 uncharacterized protein LOC111055478 [Nilaparvata lugens]
MDPLSEIALRIFANHYSPTKDVEDDDWELLYHMFGSIAERALELCEWGSIHEVETVPVSTFGLYKVVSDSRKEYYVFKNDNICQCSFFKYHVRNTQSKPACKHVLYCRLALIFGKIGSPITIKLEELGNYLHDVFAIGGQLL